MVLTADAMHTQEEHVKAMNTLGLGWMLILKDNQPSLYAAADSHHWQDEPVLHGTSQTGHGRHEIRTMCATRRSAISLAQRGEIGGISLDLMANLDLKGEGKNSMPENRRSCPGVWGEVPGGPRDMAKAGLH